MKLTGAARTHPLYIMTVLSLVFYLFARYMSGFIVDGEVRGMFFIVIGPFCVFGWLIAAVNCLVGDDGR